MDLKNTVINNVLCYFQSMRDVPKDNIVEICSLFYSYKDIIEAKDLIFDLLGETSVRRQTENKIKVELNDIYDAFKLSVDKSQTLPKFVAHGVNAFPPSSGFEIISKQILPLIDEIAALKTEVSELKKCSELQQKGLENCVDIKEDLANIKKFIMKPEIIIESNNAENTSYAAVSKRHNRKRKTTNTNIRGPMQNVLNQNGRRESVTPNAVSGAVEAPVESSTLEGTHQAQSVPEVQRPGGIINDMTQRQIDLRLQSLKRHHSKDKTSVDKRLRLSSGATITSSDHSPSPQVEKSFRLPQDYPVIWDGLLRLKDRHALVKMHFLSGSLGVAIGSLGGKPEEKSCDLTITQRMKLEKTQLDNLASQMVLKNGHCILLAVPFGRNDHDLHHQQANLDQEFVKYFEEKRGAGIVCKQNPESKQPAYMIHLFPPCDFADDTLKRIAPKLLSGIGDSLRLIVVIVSC